MAKYLVGAVALIILLGGAYYWWNGGTPEPVVEEPEVIVPTTSTYASSTLGISVTYPNDFSVEDTYTYDAFGADKLIHGVSFIIPMSMATGTNLSSDSYVSIETLPRARSCSGDIYLLANVKAEEVTDAGTLYSLATSSEAAAGNRYEEHVFALPTSKPCTAVRYFIHSTAIENFEAGTVREFDRSALLSAFDAIRRSLVLNTAAVTPTPSATTTP